MRMDGDVLIESGQVGDNVIAILAKCLPWVKS